VANRFSVEAIFKGIDKISAPVSRMAQRIGRFTRGAGRQVSGLRRQFDSLQRGARSFGLAAGVALGLVGVAVADVVKTGAEFEQSIVNATVKVGGLDQQSQKFIDTQKLLTDEARKLGRTTEFTARQAAEGLNTLVMAGFSAEQSTAALAGVLDLATIAQIDMAEAADVATGALGAFNLKTDDAAQLATNLARVNDVLAKTTITSKNTMVDLSEALKDGGPAAKVAGADIETFAAIAGRMADGNIRGTKAGTTMKNMFLKLAKPAADAQKLLKKWDITTMDAEGNMKDIVDILGSLERELDQLGTGQRAAAIETIFGKRAISGVSILLEKGTKDLRAYRDTLSDVSGESGKMADITRNTVGGSLKALLSSIESVKLSIAATNEGELKNLIDSMTQWVRANESLIAADINDIIKGFVDNKDDIVFVAKAFKGVASAIWDGVKALREMKGLIDDVSEIPLEEGGTTATDILADIFKQFDKPAKGTGKITMTPEQRMLENFRILADEDRLQNWDNQQTPAVNVVTPDDRQSARQAGQGLGRGEVMIRTQDGVSAEIQKEDPNLKLNVTPSGGQ
jgi:TP901 family phage tail tape measure protein